MKTVVAFAVAALIAAPALAAPLPRPAAFAQCSVCHKTEAGAPNGLGPNLWGVGGRVSGSVPGFAYSPALKAAKIKWNKADLVAFITAPQKRVPGNRMPYAGQKDPAASGAIADYLLSLK